ncbi:hypothetical protein V3C99_005301 [Haemonchus contortus]
MFIQLFCTEGVAPRRSLCWVISWHLNQVCESDSIKWEFKEKPRNRTDPFWSAAGRYMGQKRSDATVKSH